MVRWRAIRDFGVDSLVEFFLDSPSPSFSSSSSELASIATTDQAPPSTPFLSNSVKNATQRHRSGDGMERAVAAVCRFWKVLGSSG